MTHLVVLDCEAIQALRDPGHPRHRRVVSHAQVVASRKRRAVAIQMVVPTAVRVEAGWDRSSPAWAFPNRLRPRSTRLAGGMTSGRSPRPEPGLAVEELPGNVQVTGMSRGLLDHVQHHPAHIRRFVLPGDTVPAARPGRQRRHRQHRI